MKILIYGINFKPELTGVGKYTGEMVEWLAQKGHEVKVVTAPPYYPQWRIGRGYSPYRYRQEKNNNISIWRCPLWIPASPSGIKRLIHLFSFTASSFPILLYHALLWRPDVIWLAEPPLFCAPQAWLASKLGRAKSWLHIQDFEVDAAFELGLLPKGFIQSFTLNIEKWVMQRFDRISTISNNMIIRLMGKGVCKDKSFFFPNWVDTKKIYPASDKGTIRQELSISDETTVALYSGNMGEKQGLELLIAAASKLSSRPDILFILCGEGGTRERLVKKAEGLENIMFIPLQPIDKLNELLNMADIHLLPQRSDAADLVMPSKLTGMLASGRPIIATADDKTEIARTLEGSGITVPPEDVDALTEAILTLHKDSHLRAKMGKAAREFAVHNLGVDSVLLNFESELIRLVSSTDADTIQS